MHDDKLVARPVPDTAACVMCGEPLSLEPRQSGEPSVWIHINGGEVECGRVATFGEDDLASAVLLLRAVQEQRGRIETWAAEREAGAQPIPLPPMRTRVPSKYLLVDLETGHVWEPSGSDGWREVREPLR